MPQPSEERRPRRRFGNFDAHNECNDDDCKRDHEKAGKGPSSRSAPAPGAKCHCDHVDSLIADAITDERLFRAVRADVDRLMARDAAPLREPPSSEESRQEPRFDPRVDEKKIF